MLYPNMGYELVATSGYPPAIIISHPISLYVSKQHFGSNFRVFLGGRVINLFLGMSLWEFFSGFYNIDRG